MLTTSTRLAVVLAWAALAACGGSPAQVGRSDFGPMTCPNLSALSQQYMQGEPGIPVRCGKQAEPYF